MTQRPALTQCPPQPLYPRVPLPCTSTHRAGWVQCPTPRGPQVLPWVRVLRVPGTERGSEQQGPALTPVSISAPGHTTTSPISPIPNPFRDESGPVKTPRERLGRRCPGAGRCLRLSSASWCCRIRHPDTCGRLSPASPAPGLRCLRLRPPQLSCASYLAVAPPRPLGRGPRPGLHGEGSVVGHTGLGQG